MLVIGLTGGIGMGKSVVARQFAALGAKICSADAIVHVLLAGNSAVRKEIEKHFSGAVKGGTVDRKALGALVFKDEAKRRKLESILHPKVVAAEERFVAKQRRLGARVVLLEIPLLYETGAESRCHLVAVVSAPAFLQRQRILRRPGMTEEKFLGILAAQMSDREKRQRADVVIQTGLGRGVSFRQVATLMRRLHAA